MAKRESPPRAIIEMIDDNDQLVLLDEEDGQKVPLLDAGAYIERFTRGRIRYREYWTEEEDLSFTYEVTSSNGATKTTLHSGIHGNIGYELIVRGTGQHATLRIDYFVAIPRIDQGALVLDYEPKSVTFTGSLKNGSGIDVRVDWQRGFSVEPGQPFFKYLRVRCR